MIAPHGLLHSHIHLRGATLVTFGPLWIVAHNRISFYLDRLIILQIYQYTTSHLAIPAGTFYYLNHSPTLHINRDIHTTSL